MANTTNRRRGPGRPPKTTGPAQPVEGNTSTEPQASSAKNTAPVQAATIDELRSPQARNVSYTNLLDYLASKGWEHQLVMRGHYGVDAGFVIVDFDLFMALRPGFVAPVEMPLTDNNLFHAGIGTVSVPANIMDISMAARQRALFTFIHSVFDRVPPRPPMEQPAPAADPERGTVNGTVTSHQASGIATSAVDVDDALSDIEETLLTDTSDVDASMMLIDPYDIKDFDANETVNGIISLMRRGLADARSPEDATELYTRNKDAMDFVYELGNDKSRTELKSLFQDASDRLSQS